MSHLTRSDVHALAALAPSLEGRRDSWAAAAGEHLDLAERLGKTVDEEELYSADIDDSDDLDARSRGLRRKNEALGHELRQRERSEALGRAEKALRDRK